MILAQRLPLLAKVIGSTLRDFEGDLKFPTSNRKIPIISPGLIFVQKAVLLGFFSGELILGGAYYWKEFCVSK